MPAEASTSDQSPASVGLDVTRSASSAIGAASLMRRSIARASGGCCYAPRPMLKHNSYFDGNVQSIGFERHGRRMTAGVIAPGEYHFGTDAPERMSVVSGELDAKIGDVWRTYPAGTSFE